MGGDGDGGGARGGARGGALDRCGMVTHPGPLLEGGAGRTRENQTFIVVQYSTVQYRAVQQSYVPWPVQSVQRRYWRQLEAGRAWYPGPAPPHLLLLLLPSTWRDKIFITSLHCWAERGRGGL